MGIFDIFKRKQDVADNDVRRRLEIYGRITDGTIIDTETTPEGEVVFYVYTLNGVDFESSELLTGDKLSDPLKYAPGAKVGVRYDPRNQGNSMLE